MFDFDQDGVISQQDLKMTYASLDRPDVEDEEVKQMISEVNSIYSVFCIITR